MKLYQAPIFLFVLIGLNACMSTTALDVIKPADIDVPKAITSFGVVQRNEAAEGDKMGKRLEGFLTGEGIGVDKRSAVYVVNGLVLELSKSPKYTIKQAELNEQLYGTGKLMMAPALDWNMVEAICNNNGVDALIVVEGFDSDVNTDIDFRDVEKKVEGGAVTERVFSARMNVDTDVNWRLYDPQTKTIIDTFHDNVGSSEKRTGSSESSAKRNLPSTERLVKRGAEQLGVRYARRISPTKVKVQRDYYSKGSYRMKSAKKKMQLKDYDGAISLWDQEYRLTFKSKQKKKAAFNLALGYEAKSDFEQAIYWADLAKKAGSKKESYYYKLLVDRQYDNDRLNEQLDEKK